MRFFNYVYMKSPFQHLSDLVSTHNYQVNILSHFLGHYRLFGQESKKRGTPTELNAIIRFPIVAPVFACAREP